MKKGAIMRFRNKVGMGAVVAMAFTSCGVAGEVTPNGGSPGQEGSRPGWAVPIPETEANRPTLETANACWHVDCGEQSCSDGICNALSWSAELIGDYDGVVDDVAMAPDGDVILVGAFDGSIETKEGFVHSSEGADGYVAKMGPAGELRWLLRLGEEGRQRITAVDVDAEGNIAIGGLFDQALEVGGIALVGTAQDDAFVALLDVDGRAQWAKGFGDGVEVDGSYSTAESQSVSAVTFAKGHVVAAGRFFGGVVIDGVSYEAKGDESSFLMSLGDGGQVEWAMVPEGDGVQRIAALGLDDQERLFVAGSFSKQMKLGGELVEAVGSQDVLIAGLDLGGGLRWVRAYGGVDQEVVTGLALDPGNGDLVLTGWFQQELPFSDRPDDVLAGEGGYDGFVARIREDGSFRTARAFGAELNQQPSDISIDERGNVTVVGSFYGNLDFDLGFMTADGKDAFVALLDRDLMGQWSHRYGALGAQRATAVAHLADNATALVGTFEEGIDLGSGLMEPTLPQARGIFVAVVAP
jgi:hypothetical protein